MLSAPNKEYRKKQESANGSRSTAHRQAGWGFAWNESWRSEQRRDRCSLLNAHSKGLLQLLTVRADEAGGAAGLDLLDARTAIGAGLAFTVADDYIFEQEAAFFTVQV